MKKREMIYITAIVIGIMLPGAILFYMFNLPLANPNHELDPFNKFIVSNWMMITLSSLVASATTVVTLFVLENKLLNPREKLKQIHINVQERDD